MAKRKYTYREIAQERPGSRHYGKLTGNQSYFSDDIIKDVYTGDIWKDEKYIAASNKVKAELLEIEEKERRKKLIEESAARLRNEQDNKNIENNLSEKLFKNQEEARAIGIQGENTEVSEINLLSNSADNAYNDYWKNKKRLAELEKKTFAGKVEEAYKRFQFNRDFGPASYHMSRQEREKLNNPLVNLMDRANSLVDLLAAHIGGAVESLIGGLTGSNLTKREEEEYDKLRQTTTAYMQPYHAEAKQLIEGEYKRVENKFKNIKDKQLFIWEDKDSRMLRDIQNLYEEAIETYDDLENDRGYMSGFGKNRMSMFMLRKEKRIAEIMTKVQNEEPLTELEEEYIKALDTYNISEGTAGEFQRASYRIGKGVRDSAEFMAEMIGPTKLLKTLKIAKWSKSLLYPPLMPRTYLDMYKNRNESFQTVEHPDGRKEYVFSDKQKFSAVEDLQREAAIIDGNIAELKRKENKTEEDEENLNYLYGLRLEYDKEIDNLIDDETKELRNPHKNYFQAGLKSYNNQALEAWTEAVGGGLIEKSGKYLLRKSGATAIGRRFAATDFAKGLGKTNAYIASGRINLDNKLFGNKLGKISKFLIPNTGDAKILHNIPAEYGEEILNQLIPTYGDRYVDKLNELGNADFHTDVLASTLILGGKGALLGKGQQAIAHKIKMARDPEYRLKYNTYMSRVNDAKMQYAEIDALSTEVDDEVAKTIAMGTIGSIFNIKEYEYKIAQLKKENPDGLSDAQINNKVKAMEKVMFTNLALNALQTGTQRQFRRSLAKLSINKNVSENTRQRAVEGIKKLNALEAILEKNKDRINGAEITNLEWKKEMYKTTAENIAEEKNSLREDFKEVVDKFNEQREEKGETTFGSDLVEYGLENDFDKNDMEFNTYLADLLETNKDSEIVQSFTALTKQVGMAKFAEEEISKKLKYETNPANEKEIKKREEQKIVDNATNIITLENAEDIKQQLKDAELDTPEVLEKINKKIIELTSPAPKTHDKPKVEEITPEVIEEFANVEDIEEPPAVKTPPISQTKGQSSKPINEKISKPVNTENTTISSADLFGDETSQPTELSPEEQADLDAIESGMYSPHTYDPQNEKQNALVDTYAGIISRVLEKQPTLTFEGLVASLFGNSKFGSEKTNKNFNFLKESWNKVAKDKISGTQASEIYNKFFLNENAVSEFADATFESRTPNTQKVTTTDIKESDKGGETVNKEYNPETKREEEVPIAPHTTRKYAGVGLKLGGVLGIDYTETEEGKKDVTNTVKESAKPFMDYRNFRPGSKISFVFNIGYLLNPKNLMSIWDNLEALNTNEKDEKPSRSAISVKDRLVELFGSDPNLNSWSKIVEQLEKLDVLNKKILSGSITKKELEDFKNNPLFKNEEFLKIIPVGVINDGYTSSTKEDGTPADAILDGGLNDYYWFNNSTLALKINGKTGEPLLAEREVRLQKNRELNLQARQSILSSGVMELEVSENRDAKNNTRLLKTAEEKQKGYTKEFHSILNEFGGSVAEFKKNAAIARFDDNGNLIGSVDNSGINRAAVIDGKKVEKNQILNYDDYVTRAKKSGFFNGRTVFIHKEGVNSKEEPVYLIHDVINNHESKAEEFKKVRDILDKLYFKLAIHENDSEKQKEFKKDLQKKFKDQFGYEFTTGIKKDLESVYADNRVGHYRQDFRSKEMTPGRFDKIPNLKEYESAEQLIEALTKGEEIAKIDKWENLLSNLHTNLVFTPIEKNGETVYTIHSQPIMSFDFGKNVEQQLESLNNQTASEQQGQVGEAVKEEVLVTEQQQKADIPLGKIPNTNYEVKVDGVYFEGKKLDNPKNLSHKELITEDIKRRKQEALNPIITEIEEVGEEINKLQKEISNKQFQKLTTEEKAKTIEQVTKEHRSIAALKDLSAKLAHRIGGKVEFVNRTDVDWKGYNQGMASVLNEAYMTPDTPFHEILAHPIIRAIKNKNVRTTSDGVSDFSQSKLYQSLLKELETGRGKEVLEQVKRDYKYKDGFEEFAVYDSESQKEAEEKGATFSHKNEDGEAVYTKRKEYTLEEQQEEAIVTLLGMMAADKLDAKKDATLISKLKELWKQISDFVKSLLRQDGIKIDELPITTTLNDLAEIMAYGDNKIILPGYKVEYSTPLGNKYETLEEVNNEIRGLADANVEVDLSGINVNNDLPKSFYLNENDEHNPTEHYFEKDGQWYLETHGDTFLHEEKITKEKAEKDYKKYAKYQINLNSFIEKNKEYEQSKEIIEQWKKENNIQYDPEEVYSRGQGFYSSVGAYSNLELDLLLKNLIQHIEDNKKAGGEFTISAFTKPIDKRLKHIEGTGDRVRFVIYPKSNDIKWAAPTDVYSGSVWDAHEKVSKDKKSELLGVSFTKAPTLRNINEVSPNLTDIIDNLSHVHNELGIELTTNNFRIEYDDNIDYSTKKLIDNINKILDDKYGKLEKPEIKKTEIKTVYDVRTKYGLQEKGFNSEKEARAYINNLNKQYNYSQEEYDDFRIVSRELSGKQPTQTRDNTTSIESIRYNILNNDLGYDYYYNGKLDKNNNEIESWILTYNGKDLETFDREKDVKREVEKRNKENPKKEYTNQALINLKIAALKEVARKYPKSLITSRVVPINKNLIQSGEIQYSKLSNGEIKSKIEKLENRLKELKQQFNRINAKYDAELAALETEQTSKPKEFDDSSKADINEELIGRVLPNLDISENITSETIFKAIEQEFDNLVKELEESGKTEEANYMKENKNEILGITVYDGSIREAIDVQFDITNIETELTQVGENVKELDSNSFEVDITKSLSFKTKIMLSSIKNPKQGEGFGGLNKNMPAIEALDALHQILSESNNNSLLEIERVIKTKIEKNPNEFGFYQEILERLKKVGENHPEILNEILYNLYQPGTKMRFVMWAQDRSGKIVARNYDANVRNPVFLKRNLWSESLKKSGLVDLYEGNKYKVNEARFNQAQELHRKIIEAYQKNHNILDVDRQDFTDFLKLFGIELNEVTIDNMYAQKSQNDLDLVENLLAGTGIVNNLFKNLEVAKNSNKELSFDSVTENKDTTIELDLLTRRNTRLNDLIKADNFVEFVPMGTMYIAGKTINMYQQHNAIENKVKNLLQSLRDYQANKDNADIPEEEKMSGLLKDLKETPITSNSFLVGLMERNPEQVIKYLDTFLISLEAIKEAGTKSRDDMGITELSDKDSFVTMMGLFASTEGVFTDLEIEDRYDKKIKLRKGVINFPTISDSSQLPFLKTILLSLTKENVDLQNNKLDESVLSILRDQLLISDLLRTADYITKVGETSSNISGYDAGAMWITGMPSLNTVQVPYTYKVGNKEVETVRPLIYVFREYIKENSGRNNIESIKEFVDKYKNEINAEINKNVNNEVDKYISPDLTSGQFVDFKLMKGEDIALDDGRQDGYFKDKNARLVAYDYVVNYLLQQKEIQTIFAGDIAQYFKDKMEKNMEHGLPKVDFQDVVDFHYSDSVSANRINQIVKEKDISELSVEDKQILISEFPELRFTSELLTSEIDAEEAYRALLPVVSIKVQRMFKDVQNNLSKRLKGQISPGNQYSETKNAPNYIQIMVSDVINASETIEQMAKDRYPAQYEKLKSKIKEFKTLTDLYDRDSKQETRYNKLKKELSAALPNIAGYLDITSTDAQEYTSWKENLNQLLTQGRLTRDRYDNLVKKLEAQAKDLEEGNTIKEENLLTDEEKRYAIMQPTKPLYSGINHEDINGHRVPRYVYIKSSSFPLLPEMTQMFPKMNNLRKNIERIEKEKGTTVRVSYQSANKVGGVKNPISIGELYNDNVDLKRISDSSVSLPRENFYIQQDKPFKSDKNAQQGKPDRVVRATQFEKIILGDGINQIGYEFPSEMFDQELLQDLEIEIKDGKINGQNLKQIYNELYKREQKILSDKLFNKLGIQSYADIKEGKPDVMEKLVDLLNKRLTNKQDKKALELVYKVKVGNSIKSMSKAELAQSGLTPYKAEFKIPIFMTPNSRKFESVLNSVINKSNINLEISGFSSPVASQEGFDYKGYSEAEFANLREKGLVVHPNFDSQTGLKVDRYEDGSLKYAQVFLPNKFKLYNSKTGKYEYLDLAEYVNEDNVLDLDKIPNDLLSMFSFRIPTSSHQSGAVIEIAGFLPHNMADLMIVPKEHTTQIGEDYDIDSRYVYQYNFTKDSNGKIKKIQYSDIQKPERNLLDYMKDYNQAKENFWENDEILGNIDDPYLKNQKNKILELLTLQDAIDNFEMDNMLSLMLQEQYEIDNISKYSLQNKYNQIKDKIIPPGLDKKKKRELDETLTKVLNKYRENINNELSDLSISKRAYDNAMNQKTSEQQVLENNLIAMYKSVYSSQNQEVRNLISKVLSTDFSETSASEIDNKLSQEDGFFNIYNPTTQRQVMKAGADGKFGIGVHSNSVTINSILQQLNDKMQFVKYTDEETGIRYPYNIRLGNNVFDGVLGKIDNGKRRLSEYLMESQNSATDNQKLEIMSRRNENAETINVFSLLQLNGLEQDGIIVHGKELSYASLLISQPILLDYVNTIKKYKSSTNKSFGSSTKLATKELKDKWEKKVPTRFWKVDENGEPIVGTLSYAAREEIGKTLTSSYLYEQLQPLGVEAGLDGAAQYYILAEVFEPLQSLSKVLGELQQFVNIESQGMGISYFDTISLKNSILKMNSLPIIPQSGMKKKRKIEDSSLFSEMFGDLKIESNSENFQSLEDDGYVFISEEDNGDRLYVKPNNHYSHKIMNSISLGYNLWNSLFPYDHKYISEQIDNIISLTGVKPDSKEAKELRYDIIASMKDYSYSSSKTLFDNDVEAYQQSLFFDNKEKNQESLGSYLLRLKNTQETKNLFDKPFFRDLQIEIGEKDYPTIVKYNTGDMTPINVTNIYNLLETMSKSDKVLPSKLNGKQMTEADLMKELFMYSLLADQGNGAIGFRQLLPMSLFTTHNVDAMLRNRNAIGNSEMTNFIYNGTNNAIQSFLGSLTDSNGVIANVKKLPKSVVGSFVTRLNTFVKAETGLDNVFIMDNHGNVTNTQHKGEDIRGTFLRQYIQHNPEKIKYHIRYNENKNSNFSKLLREANVSFEDFNDGKMIGFTTSESYPPFLVLRDKADNIQLFERIKSNNLGRKTLYEYRRIPVLGVFGFNEYQVGKDINKSKVAKNNFDNEWKPQEVIVPVPSISSAEVSNPSTIVDNMLNNYEGHYKPLIDAIKQFLPELENIQVKVAPNLKGRATFKNTNGQLEIIIDEGFLNRKGANSKEVQDAVIEELLHHVTTTTFSKYGTFTNITENGVEFVPKEGVTVPASLQTLVSVYNVAIKHYANKYGIDSLLSQIGDFQAIIKGEKKGVLQITEGITEDSYRAMNVHEFIAGIMIKDSNFAKEMAETPYLKSGKSILEKFSEALSKLIERILPGAKKDSISANLASSLLSFLEEHHNTTSKTQNITKDKLSDNTVVEEAQNLLEELNNEDDDTPPWEDPKQNFQPFIGDEFNVGDYKRFGNSAEAANYILPIFNNLVENHPLHKEILDLAQQLPVWATNNYNNRIESLTAILVNSAVGRPPTELNWEAVQNRLDKDLSSYKTWLEGKIEENKKLIIEGKKNLQKEVFRSNKGYTIDEISKLGTFTKEQKNLINEINKALGKNETKFIVVNQDDRDTEFGKRSSKEAHYKSNTGNIYFKLETVGSGKKHMGLVITHEYIHALTVRALSFLQAADLKQDNDFTNAHKDKIASLTNKQKEAYEDLKTILKELRDKTKGENHYGLTNVFELLAELANPEFRDVLQKHKFLENKGNKILKFFRRNKALNGLEIVIERILTMLGIETGPTVIGAYKTLLSEFSKEQSQFADSINKEELVDYDFNFIKENTTDLQNNLPSFAVEDKIQKLKEEKSLKIDCR